MAWFRTAVVATVAAMGLVLVPASHSQAQSTDPVFVDIGAEHIFYDQIAWLARTGITRGCNPPANTLFCPNQPLTRGETAAFLVRAFGLSPSVTRDWFADDNNSVFEADINAIAGTRITLGCAEDQFCPDDPVTREQMAAFLSRALRLKEGQNNTFTDDDGSVLEMHVDRLATAGITRGCNPPLNDHFCPYQSVTRAEIAAFLHRALVEPQGVASIELLTVGTDGSSADGYSYPPAMSSDGRFVAFASGASNLVPDDSNGVRDIFVYDTLTREVQRVSVSSDGAQANQHSYEPSVSATGRYVAFRSGAGNLADGAIETMPSIYVHDRTTGETTLVSIDSNGNSANDASFGAEISADGRFVGFFSNATNLVAGDTNSHNDIFLHDRVTGETTLVSVATDGTQGDGNSQGVAISAAGRYVAFISWATNLVDGDTNNISDAFVRDRLLGETVRVSVASDGTEQLTGSDILSRPIAISGDGQEIAFSSWASNLVQGDTNEATDVFVHNRDTGETTRVSVNSAGSEGNDHSASLIEVAHIAMTPDSRFVLFSSLASNLTASTNSSFGVFLHDRSNGETTRLDVAVDGTSSNGSSFVGDLSANGQVIAFSSAATNLVEGAAGAFDNVFYVLR